MGVEEDGLGGAATSLGYRPQAAKDPRKILAPAQALGYNKREVRRVDLGFCTFDLNWTACK